MVENYELYVFLLLYKNKYSISYYNNVIMNTNKKVLTNNNNKKKLVMTFKKTYRLIKVNNITK